MQNINYLEKGEILNAQAKSSSHTLEVFLVTLSPNSLNVNNPLPHPATSLPNSPQ